MHLHLGEDIDMKPAASNPHGFVDRIIDIDPGVTRSRRLLLLGMSAVAVGMIAGTRRGFAADAASAAGEVVLEDFAPSGKSLGLVHVSKIVKADADWRKQLAPDSYDITRREGTERAGTGKYAYNHADGLYRCICCDTALYDSRTKFESGTGWPSFYQPISERNIVKRSDHTFGMTRDAISCARCDAHLGHVFDDGPKPTGLRYCMNSVALNFVARA
jgi:peptide-methionine (R)-S-oxide reductase